LPASVGLLLEDRDGPGPLGRGQQRQQARRVLADVGRLPERREQVLEPLLVDLVQRECDAEVRDPVLLRDGGRGGVQVGAEAAEVADDALGRQRLQPAHRLGGVGLVVEQRQLERHLLAAHRHAAGGVDLLHGDLVASAHLGAAGLVAPGERHHRADLHGLRPGR
jgi:hypothetical protein